MKASSVVAIAVAALVAMAAPAFAEKGDKGYVPAPNAGGGKVMVVCTKDVPCQSGSNGGSAGGAASSGSGGSGGKGGDKDGGKGDHDGGKGGHDD